VVIERAAGYFYYYRGNPYTRLIHVAKYNGRPETGRELAARFADEIINDGFFDGMDLIVSVPLHRFKKLKRGYNQTEYIAEGIARKTGLVINRNLIALKPHSSQTRKNAFERWKNSLDIYGVKNPEELENKHVLLVDDVITTGSTMLACCEAIHRAAPSATISVIALGVTNLT
jgi:ComF family protein